MSKCCCCIPVTTGAIIIGILGILLAAFELVPLVPYLLQADDFNPIEKNLQSTIYVLEKLLKEYYQLDQDQIKVIISHIKDFIWPMVLGEAISAGIFIVMSFLLVVGVTARKRGLMLPYMIIQMFMVIIFILAGIAFTVIFFFQNIIAGIVCGVVVLVVSFLLVYFWIAVQRAYVEIGVYANYSPAPMTVKPIYSHHHHYPAAPQHFQMDETMNGK